MIPSYVCQFVPIQCQSGANPVLMKGVWPWIGNVLADRSRIGVLLIDWHMIGESAMDWWIGNRLADWFRIDIGFPDRSWIDIVLADGCWIGRLALDWQIGDGLADWSWIDFGLTLD